MIGLAFLAGLVFGAVGAVVLGACLASGYAARGEAVAPTAVSPATLGTGIVQGPTSPALPHVQAWVTHDGTLHVEAASDAIAADWLARCS